MQVFRAAMASARTECCKDLLRRQQTNVFIIAECEHVAQRLVRQGLLMNRVDTTPLIFNKWHLTMQNEIIYK